MTNLVGLHGDLLTPAEAAQIMRASEKTLAQWRSQRKGPPFVKMSGRIHYLRSDIEAWIDEHRVNPADVESYPSIRPKGGRNGHSRT